jgi:hypothetical protein
MAAVLLLLPDDMLAAVDAARDGPRLVWIRGAITDKLGSAPTHRIDSAPGRSVAPSPAAAPQGTPGGQVDPAECVHPWRNPVGTCKTCGHQR